MLGWLKRSKARLTPAIAADGDELFRAARTDTNKIDDDLLFPSWPPPNPREIIAHRTFYKERMRYRQYRAPEGVYEDSPLYALYRLYEWIMVGHSDNMRNELECFWWNSWPVASIPDPGEQGDPERYAVLACIPALLVESFNKRSESGLRRDGASSGPVSGSETEPAWAAHVGPVRALMHIPETQRSLQIKSLYDPAASSAFKKKNILMRKPDLHFT